MKFLTCLIVSMMLFGCSGSVETNDNHYNDTCVTCVEELTTRPIDFSGHPGDDNSCFGTKEKYNNLFECVCDPQHAEFNDCGSFCENTEINKSVQISQRCHDYVFVKQCAEFYSVCASDSVK